MTTYRAMSSRILLLIITVLSFVSVIAGAEERLPFPLPTDSNKLPVRAVVETTKGTMVFEFLRDEAPITVSNFIYLAEKNFYTGLTFHNLVPGFIIQGGDPLKNGMGGPGYTLPPEVSAGPFPRGTVGMARADDEKNPERRSNGSQFFICLGDAPKLRGRYTAFARIVSGMAVIDGLAVGDRITRVHIEVAPRGKKE